MQLFSGVIIGLQAVGLFTDEQQGCRGASKPPTDTHQKGPASYRTIFSHIFFKSGVPLNLRFLSNDPGK